MFGTCAYHRATLQQRPDRLDAPVASCPVKRRPVCEASSPHPLVSRAARCRKLRRAGTQSLTATCLVRHVRQPPRCGSGAPEPPRRARFELPREAASSLRAHPLVSRAARCTCVSRAARCRKPRLAGTQSLKRPASRGVPHTGVPNAGGAAAGRRRRRYVGPERRRRYIGPERRRRYVGYMSLAPGNVLARLSTTPPTLVTACTSARAPSSRATRHVDAIRALLDHDANVNAAHLGGGTPLHGAAGQGHVGATQALLDAGADVHASSAEGWTALHEASYQGKIEVVILPRCTCTHGRPALHLHPSTSRGGTCTLHPLARTQLMVDATEGWLVAAAYGGAKQQARRVSDIARLTGQRAERDVPSTHDARAEQGKSFQGLRAGPPWLPAACRATHERVYSQAQHRFTVQLRTGTSRRFGRS